MVGDKLFGHLTRNLSRMNKAIIIGNCTSPFVLVSPHCFLAIEKDSLFYKIAVEVTIDVIDLQKLSQAVI